MNTTKYISSGRTAERFALRFLTLMCVGIGSLAITNPVLAAVTPAGTDIQNVATATYDTPTGPVSVNSNTVVIKVDELLDVDVARTDPGDITTAPGATNNVQTFRVTNTGNGTEAFTLTADVNKSGDDFNPTLVQMFFDTPVGGVYNGVYDAGVDTPYVAGNNDPNLAPGEGRTVFVLTNTPTTPVNGNRAEVGLRATANTGSGNPGTSFAGLGDGGGDAVVGLTRASFEKTGFLVVSAASVVLVKSATILDPFGGNKPVPGAFITYNLVATVSGSGTLNNLVISDPIPANTAYSAGTITLEAAGLTDAVDADAANYNGTRISVAAGNVPAGQTRSVTFKVQIQ
jgi:uncharacterized repeat protein (TIGR01451 family)